MTVETKHGQAVADDWVEDALGRVAELERRLDDPAVLADLASKLTRAAKELGASTLVPASRLGARIAAAATGYPVDQPNGGRALVVEGYLATGVQILRATRQARQQGATRVSAVAVSVNPAGAAFVAAELGAPVVVLEP
jgi:predicted phosphoribosyltransferase